MKKKAKNLDNGTGYTFGRWLDTTLDNMGPGAARKLAREIGVSDGAITQWRRQPFRRPEARTVQKVAEALDVDPMRLLVTAGHLDEDVVGVKPYEVPESQTALRTIRSTLERDGLLTEKDIEGIIDNYAEKRRYRHNGH